LLDYSRPFVIADDTSKSDVVCGRIGKLGAARGQAIAARTDAKRLSRSIEATAVSPASAPYLTRVQRSTVMPVERRKRNSNTAKAAISHICKDAVFVFLFCNCKDRVSEVLNATPLTQEEPRTRRG
jgi:hypothetical protein